MFKLSLIILFIFALQIVVAQSPHGEDFDIDCADCHSTDEWKVKTSEMQFEHGLTGFEMMGQHASLDCRSCHTSLVFSSVKSQCYECHLDMHQNTVGNDCSRCHTPKSWLIDNITEIHQLGRFPLIGAHTTADCQQCHLSSSKLQFEPIGIECYDCHLQDYAATQNPNHAAAGFSTECRDCHDLASQQWSLAAFAHEFFPLTGGHNISNCFDCHQQGNFEGLSTNCVTCHQPDYNATVNPNHLELTLPTDCMQCHTTNLGWEPASFAIHNDFYQLLGAHANISNDCASCHNGNYIGTPNECIGCHENDYNSVADPNHAALNFSTDCETCHSQNAWIPSTFDHDGQFFPIYSGKHSGEWDACSDCHVNPSNFQIFECINCHEHNKDDTDQEHQGVQGYIYASTECFACHPTGDAEGSFNHANSTFPLTGAHTDLECSQCHQTGYAGTPKICIDCHINDFQNSVNPDHQSLQISTDCELCHSTNPNWEPAQFPNHNDFFVLLGAHAAISNDCSSCHNGDYNNTPTMCIGCHDNDYNNTNNPPHQTAGFPNDCEECHSETEWVPATFDHDGQYFPIYSGKHNEEWNTCSDCHTNQANYSIFSCITCHEHNQALMDEEHEGVEGYVYESTECFACHPIGDSEGAFNHLNSIFPLTGAHAELECSQCHATGYAGTSTICVDCHLDDFQNSSNPNHQSLQLSNDCQLCHTTNPIWEPAQFPNHNDFFVLMGAHATISNECSSCHKGDYNNTPTLCYDCHVDDFNNSTNPDHQSLQLSTECQLCHTIDPNWEPAQFPNHNDFFVLIGAHAAISNDCSSCHNGNYNNTPTMCIGCHDDDYNNTTNPPHQTAGFPNDCEECHTESAWVPATFDHDGQYFPIYSGEHNEEWNACSDCHTDPTNYAVFSCITCHEHNQASMDDKHSEVTGYIYASTECYACHPNGQGQGAFNHTTSNFPLTGAHGELECSQCHATGYAGTSTICVDCHLNSFQNTSNPDHETLQLSTDCELCHTTNPNWQPAAFPNHNNYFALLGAHAAISNECSSCHNGNYNNTPTICYDCHIDDFNNSTNPNHQSLQLSTECQLCHTIDPNWEPAQFPNHNNYYALIGPHTAISNECSSCHNGNYNNTPIMCIGCHDDDYNNTTNPPHQAAGFPNDCEECHSQTAWIPSTFDHDGQYFPIYSGNHNEEWNVCSDCHTNPTNYSIFSCITCHEHNQASMDDEHSEVTGYVYNSDNCYDCHPNGDSFILPRYEEKMERSIK